MEGEEINSPVDIELEDGRSVSENTGLVESSGGYSHAGFMCFAP